MSIKTPISILLYHRLMSYLRFLKELPENGRDNVSSSFIAAGLGVNHVQVRKDLAIASNGGKPKIGYNKKDLILDLEHYFGHDNCLDAVLVGVGNLGKALISYEAFKNYGLRITMAFDSDTNLIGTKQNGIEVWDVSGLSALCKKKDIQIGIVATPSDRAQDICNQLVDGGVCAIWNFAPVSVRVPEHIIVKNEDMAASLAVLTKQLGENLLKN